VSISALSKEFLHIIEKSIGPFDRPFRFHVFPFSAGGDLNFLTVGQGGPFATYISWDLFGHEEQKRGSLGRYELLAVCDDERWCLDILTKVGRQTLHELFEPGDTFDIGPWVTAGSSIQGVLFDEALRLELQGETCGLLRCVGITRSELEFATRRGVPALVECLIRAAVYPRTSIHRNGTVELTA
jgi:hypothetical protein